ncbi:MAG: hypothetical protein QOK02_4173 [Mycobacterium sp.]|jgi:hypothetical protein|nr:hypothetical protein [Mycobacterium sp.]
MTAVDDHLATTAPVSKSRSPQHTARSNADHTARWIAMGAAFLSIAAYAYFASRGEALGYRDSISHLQIAARTLQSPTAGFGQLGGVWLPLPHILMLPLVWIKPFYYSGFAGSAISMISFVIASRYVYKIGFGLTKRQMPAIAGTLVFALNPNVLYLQSTAMTELLLFATITASTYYAQKWIQAENHSGGYRYLLASACAAFLGCLARYEAWTLTAAMAVVVVFVAWRRYGVRAAEGIALSYLFLAGAAAVIWMGWNWLIFGSPLNFQNGEYAKPSLWVSNREQALGHTWIAIETVWYAVVDNLGIALMMAMLVGAVLMVVRRRGLDVLPVLSLLTIAPFFVLALAVGQRPLHVVQLTGDLYNIRFGLLLVLPAAIMVTYLVSLVPPRWTLGAVAVAALTTVSSVMWGGLQEIATLAEAGHGPTGIINNVSQGQSGTSNEALETSQYLHKYYDDGLILSESFGNESILFDARIPLSNNVYEGSYQMWKPALRYPSEQHIKWIVMRTGRGGWSGTPPNGDWSNAPDEVYRQLNGSTQLNDYDRVFTDALYTVYKRKNQP